MLHSSRTYLKTYFEEEDDQTSQCLQVVNVRPRKNVVFYIFIYLNKIKWDDVICFIIIIFVFLENVIV